MKSESKFTRWINPSFNICIPSHFIMAASTVLIQTHEPWPSPVGTACVPRYIQLFVCVCVCHGTFCTLTSHDSRSDVASLVAAVVLLPVFTPCYFLCLGVLGVYTVFIHKTMKTRPDKGGSSVFTISLLIQPLTVKSCLNSKSLSQERRDRPLCQCYGFCCTVLCLLHYLLKDITNVPEYIDFKLNLVWGLDDRNCSHSNSVLYIATVCSSEITAYKMLWLCLGRWVVWMIAVLHGVQCQNIPQWLLFHSMSTK